MGNRMCHSLSLLVHNWFRVKPPPAAVQKATRGTLSQDTSTNESGKRHYENNT